MNANKKIRDAMKNKGVRQWQVALRLGVSDQTLIRWLRVPLTADKESAVLAAVEELSKEV